MIDKRLLDSEIRHIPVKNDIVEVYLVDFECLCINKEHVTKETQLIMNHPLTIEEAIEKLATITVNTYYYGSDITDLETKKKIERAKTFFLLGTKVNIS